MWAALAVSAVLAAVPADAGQLQIKNDRFTYGILGQDRSDDKVIPGDTLIVAFDIEGLQVKEDGIVKYSTSMELLNKDGKSEFSDTKPTERESINTLGGSHLPCWSRVSIGTDTPPGQYTVKISVADTSVKGGKPVTFERKFEVVAPRFGIILTGLGYDKPPLAPPPAPPLAVPGQQLLAFFTVVGFETKPGATKDKLTANVHVELSILDDSGKPTLSKPYTGDAKDITEEYKAFVPFQFPLPLNRAGKFKVRITVTDKLSKKPPVTQELDLTVLDVK
ncbi:MAG TPA: hypothetical protein DDY78_03210 [Planctomycetales bacterium]|jgi:hypothetical protein|nr:hypothetical protein [Planctomycetales bacterium]